MASGAGKSKVMAAVGTGSVSAAAVAALSGKSADAAAKPAKAKKADAPAKAAKEEAPAKAEKKAAPKAKKAEAAGDDLTQISGVGPVIVEKLHGEGITTFAQIAAWTEADVEAIEEKLSFKGRVGREDWIAQAKELTKG